ncbi:MULTISPECIES: ABC transporter permease [unclassified Ruegeria]|jgi:simple sugar transport system permease protein|uniref:ABC transporter permease n=1 Tax=unclassified Ruegeria TaxID=2625375 RepID=UPI00126796E9|nr:MULTISPECIES: ABC transporter permease [unclassified Ruegeria]NOC83540.1 ABC transporter permease [Ruegeria sp. HKCCD6428]NOE28332.1 ABC transporter permease [Ruegeria sp. HKCCD6157]QFT74105.1 Inner membrane ABC transporter permease protein YjfF [Ruegeria sp. THAF33]
MSESAPVLSDERVKKEPFLTKLMKRPELGAIAGAVLVFVFFAITADESMFTLAGVMNFMTPAAQLGILAIGAALLMIGGEFDLSIGSMVAFSGLFFGVCVVTWQLPLIFAIPMTFVFAACVGAINGNIVIRSGLPSFIVTLAFLFILRGLSLVGLKMATGGSTQLRGVRDAVENDWLAPFFSGEAFGSLFAWLAANGMIDTFKSGAPKVPGIPVEILWFIVITLAATYVLLRTPVGNWIFASGGDSTAASNSGVPVNRVKVSLFMLTACCAALVAIITVMDAGSTDARRGFQKEFEAIIAAVIGGCLLTGGYGSAIGAFFGSIIFGMVVIGLTYTDFDQDWFQVFLGAMLLIAVLFNNAIRKRVTGER